MKLVKLREIAMAATAEHVETKVFLKTSDDFKKRILEGFSSSIDASISHDGGHDYIWNETSDEVIIGIFGNGPTSLANATYFAQFSPAMVLKLLDCVSAAKLLSSFAPRGEIQPGLCPTFYHTLDYNKEVELQKRVDAAIALVAEYE